MITSSFLDDLRRRAIRRRVWFRALDSLERKILGLSVRVLDSAVKFSSLGKVLTSIVAKIEDALKSVFERRLEGYGLRRAAELAEMAAKLGCVGARRWVDSSFARYVTFMSLNMPVGWSF